MPLIEAGFSDQENGIADHEKLLRFGPTTQVIVAPLELPENLEELKTETVFALIDTGASQSMIDNKLALKLGLIPVDKSMVSGVTGPQEHLMYLMRIVCLQLEIQQYGKFLSGDINPAGNEHDVLLGRDFLANTIMIYDGIRAQVTIASPKRLK